MHSSTRSVVECFSAPGKHPALTSPRLRSALWCSRTAVLTGCLHAEPIACLEQCRNGFSHDLAALLLEDLRAALQQLHVATGPGLGIGPTGFHH